QTRTTVGAEDDDAAWLEILKSYGYKDEQAFRDKLKRNDLVTMLYDAYELEPTDVELVSFIAQNPTAVEDYTLPAYEAAVEVAAANAPDADPDATPAPVTVSPDDVDLKSIPESALAQFKELWSNSNKGTAFQDWVKELVDNADIVINEMPANVPYNVDMNLAESDTNSTANPASDSSSPEAVAAARAEGLIIVDDVVGDGDEAVSGSTAYMHYIGTLEDGTVFDKNIEGDNPFEFTLGTQQVIRGWDAGVVGMKVGGKRTLTIPPALGYGDVDHGSIPANSTLKFEVELVEVK
ncbi:MAG: FKBP-type peptidyl-prolyl cis-trans isomerase, partial [Coriobacteriales bacterium]|nr:FKBP-type peptidyl-prolyl cis-trans isomerase [Coriobacteriales bacterium]